MIRYFLLLFVGAFAACSQQSDFQVVATDQGIQVLEKGSPVLFYQRALTSLDGKYSRNHYLHPLMSLAGDTLTEDFPDDHLHHRGVFWAWHQVWVGDQRVGEPWECRDFLWDVREAKVVQNDASGVLLHTVVEWKSPLWKNEAGEEKALVYEVSDIRIHPRQGALRNIDFNIRLRAMEKEMRLGGSDDEKGYGGFSVRFKWPEDLKMTGQYGAVIPQNLSVDPSPWMDFSGTFGREKSGAVILTHPSTAGFPQRWILRQSKSMQNPVFPGRDPIPLSETIDVVLRYRMVLYQGELTPAQIDQLQDEYANEAD